MLLNVWWLQRVFLRWEWDWPPPARQWGVQLPWQ